MPIQIIVPQADQYHVAGMDLWKIQYDGKMTQRDIPINPNKIDKNTLVDLLKHAGVVGISKLKKDNLIQLFNQWYIFQ